MIRALAPLALCLALMGCSGATQPAASGSAGGSAAAVSAKDLAFTPADTTVAAGDTVTWTNDDDAPHTVTFDDDAVPDSDELQKGDTFEATFDAAGTYSYICAIHPDMKAKVTVQ